ncbi:hypothetical protein ACRQ1B_06060 [Rhizobium panacihumi]|uniref:hypothetical protein n=1 Tax=Rhizobium panacihumi TaxID=2008450 RepID=UPI003D79D6A6
MPSIPDEFVPLRSTIAQPEMPAPEDPSLLDTIGAAGVESNWVYRGWRYLKNHAEVETDPDHDPFALIKDTKYEADPQRFAFSRNEDETRSIMAEWDQDENARSVISRSGWSGTVAGVGMGLLDPTIFFPVAKVFQGAARGANALRIGGDVAIAGAAGAAVGEAVMYGTTDDYTAGQVAANIGTATILSGLLGAGAGALMSRSERQAVTGLLNADRQAWGDTIAPQPQSAGAAAADTRQLELRTVPGLDKLPDPTGRISPPRRVLNSGFVSARRAVVDLVETPYIFDENLEGVATTQGPALSRQVTLEANRGRVAVAEMFDKTYSRYRTGGDENFLQKKLRGTRDLLQGPDDGKLRFPDFKDQVDLALRNGDQHDVPEVAEAARFLRANVLDPWRDRAIKAGLLPEGVDAKTADSYMMRVWNKQRLIADRPAVVQRFADWLDGEEGKKAQIQEALQGHRNLMDGYDETIEKLTSQLERGQNAADDLEVRRSEVQRLNQFAFKRSAKLSEPLDELRAAIRSVEEEAGPQLERIAELGNAIRDEKVKFPDIRDADALIFKLVSAHTKMREGRDIVAALEGLDEFAEAAESVRSGFSGGITSARQNAKQARRALGADDLVALEKARTKALAAAKPYRDELRRLRTDLQAGLDQKLPGAHGGAVFETEIRSRGNSLADRASGRAAQVDDLERRIADLTAKRDGVREQIEELIGRWEGKSASEAKAALRARSTAEADRQAKVDAGEYSGKGGRLTSADPAIDDAVRRILDKERLRDRRELEDLANEIVERLVGNPDGRLPYDRPSASNAGAAGPAMRGPLASRDFMIPDNLVREYLETDVQKVSDIYLNTMVPDVLLTERFGDVDMTETFRRLQDEHVARAAAAGSNQARTKIKAEYDDVVKDLAAMRDRIRKTYGYSSDPSQRFLGRMASTAARFDLITNLGGATLSSLSDLAGMQWRYGMTSVLRNAWGPMFKAMTNPETRKAVMAHKQQLRALGIAAETYLSSRSHSLYDLMDVYAPTSKFERAVSVAADKFGMFNAMSPWTDFAKHAAGMVSSAEITRAVEASAAGKAKPRQIRDLAESGIDGVMAERIWKQLSAEGGSDVIDGIRIPNAGAWSDAGARQAFEGMLARDVDLMVLTPGAEKPLMMSKPIAALILQYKTFVTAANERLLVRSLQARDHQVLQGMASAVALGVLAEYAYSHVANRPAPKEAADWIKAGVNRSGILGWYQEGNSIAAKWTGGSADIFRAIGADMPDARYISRSPGAALLGPVYGKFETTVSSFAKLTSKLLGGDQEWKANDTYQLRRLLPAQNLFYIRRLLDGVEDGFNETIGVEPKDRGR